MTTDTRPPTVLDRPEAERLARALCEVRDGRIAVIVRYCDGGWDDELRGHRLAEAPLLPTDEQLAR